MTFWSPAHSGDCANRFEFEAAENLCLGPSGRKVLYGGAIMATAIEALESTANKSVSWATMQYLSAGRPGDNIVIDVDGLSEGRNISQAYATVSVGDRCLQRVVAALGQRNGFQDTSFKPMPSVPPPQDCELRQAESTAVDSFFIGEIERRTAFQCEISGVEHLWVRPSAQLPRNAGLQAVLSDFLLGAHPVSRGGTSLDNTLRVFRTCPSEWILCVTEHSGFSGGLVHGVQHQYTQDGKLLCQSSQTGTLPRRNLPQQQ